jgi:hypothetical protein
MSTPTPLTMQVEALERSLLEARGRIEALRGRVAVAEQRSAAALDLIGEGEQGVPLSTSPLLAALAGVVAANAAAFGAFVTWISAMKEWGVGTGAALLLSALTLRASGRPGAGGLARLGLRRLTVAFDVVSALVLVACAFGWRR